jgi:hypothetical protein
MTVYARACRALIDSRGLAPALSALINGAFPDREFEFTPLQQRVFPIKSLRKANSAVLTVADWLWWPPLASEDTIAD